MRQPETNTDIDIIHSMHRADHVAHWDFKNGSHSITINLEGNWIRAKESVDKSPDMPPGGYTEDEYINAFIDELHESFLTEIICIERRRQGLRMKFKRCEPCCIARLVAHMVNHCHICLYYKTLPIKAGAAA
jgi:hypothetical protein